MTQSLLREDWLLDRPPLKGQKPKKNLTDLVWNWVNTYIITLLSYRVKQAAKGSIYVFKHFVSVFDYAFLRNEPIPSSAKFRLKS